MEIKNLEELKSLVELIRTKDNQPDDLSKVWYFIGQRRKLQAIKAYRMITGSPLKECKLVVEAMMERSNHFAE